MRPGSQTSERVFLTGLKFQQQGRTSVYERPWGFWPKPHGPQELCLTTTMPPNTHTLSLSCSLILVLLISRPDSVVMVARAAPPCPRLSLGRSLVTTSLAAASPGSGRMMVVAGAWQCQEGGDRPTACQEARWAEPCRLAGSVAFLPHVRGSPGLVEASWGR